jgi:hypothetical protein
MNQTVVGLTPWLPWPLARWAWWTEPVRAERLAALRIGLGLVLLVDILGFYLPHAADFYGPNSLGGGSVFPDPSSFPENLRLPRWPWSAAAAQGLPIWHLLLGVWGMSALLLVLGIWPRPAAAVAWFLSGSIHSLNPFVFNGGDGVRSILLLYLMFCPSAAVWSVRSVVPLPLRERGRGEGPPPVWVPAWPVRLIFVQMLLIYLMTGLAKLGPQWRAGDTLYYVTGSVSWMRWSQADLPVPYQLTQWLTWLTVAWEVAFPILVCWPRTRYFMLATGVLFHLGTGLALKLGPFPFYMCCLYLPVVPWERWSEVPDRPSAEREAAAPADANPTCQP